MATSPERKAYQQAYYEKNKAELLEKQRARNAAHYLANREAHKAKTLAWQAANPERAAELQRAYRERHKDRLNAKRKAIYEANKSAELAQRRISKIKSYGLTPQQFDAMLEAQGGRCAICGTDKPSKRDATFRIDHCHKSGAVRGLLCMACNSGLGMFRDHVPALMAAIEYLTRSSSGATSTPSKTPSSEPSPSED